MIFFQENYFSEDKEKMGKPKKDRSEHNGVKVDMANRHDLQ